MQGLLDEANLWILAGAQALADLGWMERGVSASEIGMAMVTDGNPARGRVDIQPDRHGYVRTFSPTGTNTGKELHLRTEVEQKSSPVGRYSQMCNCVWLDFVCGL